MMFINKDISENDKIILNSVGKNADTSIDKLLLYTKYKRKSSIYNRVRNLRSQNYLFGPYFDINYNAIGTNKLYSIFVFASYDPLYRDCVLEAMKAINCWTFIFPVRTAACYVGVYRCNNWNYIASLFNVMKKWGWLKEYSVHKSEHKWVVQNPDFFGELMPPSDYQIPKGGLPQYCFEDLEAGFELTKTDLVVLKHLSTKTCRLTEIRDLEYHYHGLKLKYYDLKRSFENLKYTGILLEKYYIIFPLPLELCSIFFFVSKGKNFKSHLEMITHFGEDLRLNKTLIVVSKEIISYFVTYPLLEGRILGILEEYLTDAKIYGIKTFPSDELLAQTINDSYFDVNSQRWVFPFPEFRKKLEKLKEKKERRD